MQTALVSVGLYGEALAEHDAHTRDSRHVEREGKGEGRRYVEGRLSAEADPWTGVQVAVRELELDDAFESEAEYEGCGRECTLEAVDHVGEPATQWSGWVTISAASAAQTAKAAQHSKAAMECLKLVPYAPSDPLKRLSAN